MSRYSPTVVPDYEPRRRPGEEIASAFDAYRQAKIEEAEESRRKTAAAREEEEWGWRKEDRPREQRRGEIEDASTEIAFEEYIRDVLGGRRVEQPSGEQEAPGPRGPPSRLPPEAPDLFEQERIGLARRPEAQASPPQQEVDLGPPQVVVLPGQFVGGGFAPEAVTVGGRQRRSIAGQTYELDPTQTREARSQAAEAQERTRTQAQEEQELQDEIEALIAAGVDPEQAEAVARFSLAKEFVKPGPETGGGWDPDDPRSFASRQDYLNFQRALADARDAIGRRPPRTGTGTDTDRPLLTLDKALAEIDRLMGTYNPRSQVYEHHLTEGERYDLARRLMSGELTGEELDAMRLREEEGKEEAPVQYESGRIRRFFERRIPGGRTGFERTDGTVGPLEPAPDEGGRRPHNTPPGPPPVLDTIRTAVDQLRTEFPNLTQAQLRMLLEEEFDPADVNMALNGR